MDTGNAASARSPTAIGERLRIGQQSFQIVGVAAASFAGVEPGYLIDAWFPISVVSNPRSLSDPDGSGIRVWGRVRPEASRPQLRERLQAVLTNFLRERVRINPPRGLRGPQYPAIHECAAADTGTLPAAPTPSFASSSVARSGFSLICALLLSSRLLQCRQPHAGARVGARYRDGSPHLAVRRPVPAIAETMIESSQIAASACILAVGFAALAAPVMASASASRTPRPGSMSLPMPPPSRSPLRSASSPYCYSASSPLCAPLPHRPVRARVWWNATLPPRRSAPLHARRQIGFSVAVLFLCGLLLRSFQRLTSVDLGFTSDNVVLFDLGPRQASRESPRPTSDAVSSMSFVISREYKSASISLQRPMGGDMVWIQTPVIRLSGGGNEAIRPREVPVSPGFFEYDADSVDRGPRLPPRRGRWQLPIGDR